MLKFLIGQETEGYDIGVEEWVLARAHMGLILQGVLHAVLFQGGAAPHPVTMTACPCHPDA